MNDFLRQMVEEGRWESASDILLRALRVSPEDAFQILKGEKRLSSLGLVDEDPEELLQYQKRLDFQFEGRIRLENFWYTPYLLVSGHSLLSPGRLQDRARLFMKNPESDLLFLYKDGVVLFCKTNPPPPWWSNPESPQESVERYLSVRKLKSHALESEGAWEAFESLHRAEINAEKAWKAYQNGSLSEDELLDAREDLDGARLFYLEEEERGNRIREYREKIIHQADASPEGWLEFDVQGNPALDRPAFRARVPRAPFEIWALRRSRVSGLPNWNVVSPSSLKTCNDDRYHTDWMIGGGIPLEAAYRDGILSSAVYDEQFRIQRERAHYSVNVLCGDGFARGKIWHAKPDAIVYGAIAVIPHAGPEYEEVARASLAVITEKGGQLSHLSVVGLESGLKMVRISNALEIFPEGTEVVVNCSEGEIWVPELP